MKAIWKDTVVAESENTVVVEGNHYFPMEDVDFQYLEETDTHTICHWKGIASYYTVKVGDQKNKDAAWTYPEPKDAAKEIKGYIAFWKGVSVSK